MKSLIIAEKPSVAADLARGIARAVIGSDAEQILRSANVPVLLVRGA